MWRRFSYTIIFALVFCGLLAMGWWQLMRYQEKSRWLAELAHTKSQPALTNSDLAQNHWASFRRIKLQGHWQSKNSFVIGGALRHGRTGYSVVTPLQWAPSMPWVLVDRGWVVSPDGRRAPEIHPPMDRQWVTGKVYSPVGKRFILGPWHLPSVGGVPVVQDWDFPKIEKLIGHSVMPFVLRLSPTLLGRYERQWSWTALPPSRHFGYMLQWWAFALVWLVGSILLIRKNKKNKKGDIQ